MTAANVRLDGKPLVWPIPNLCEWKNGSFRLRPKLSLTCDYSFDEEIEMLLLPKLREAGTTVDRLDSDASVTLRRCSDNRINGEGYILEVAVDSVLLEAKTNRGMFYGLHTFLQLLTNSGGTEIPCVSIIDSPFKPVRGVHIYIPPRHSLDWFKRYIDFLAKHRFNTIFMEIGAGMKFDSHPEINEAWEGFTKEMIVYPGGPDGGGHNSLTTMQRSVGPIKDSVHIELAGGSYLEKSEIAGLISYIKRRHIEIVPEVQSLSHTYWMLLSHKELAERSDDPYPDTYCPSNPLTYKLYFECLQEVVDLFKPGMVHIGHDEYYSIGLCEKCKVRSGNDIFAEDVTRIHDWLAERGIRTILWSDKMIDFTSSDGTPLGGRERLNYNRKTKSNERMKETYRAVDALPDDVMIMDWYYNLFGEDTGSQDLFGQRGLEVIFGNFTGHVQTFPNFTDRIRRANVRGAVCSLWSEVSELGLTIRNMFPSYLNVANLLWYEGFQDQMQPDLDRVVAQLYPIERNFVNGTGSLFSDRNQVAYIDLSRLYNATLRDIHDFSLVKTSEPLPGTIPFDTARGVQYVETDSGCVIAGHGKPDKIDGIAAAGRFRSIAFLHSYSVQIRNSSYRCAYIGLDIDIVGYYVVLYANGRTERVPLEFGRNITTVHNLFNANRSNPVYMSLQVEETVQHTATSKRLILNSKPSVVQSYEWVNPYPNEEIAGISIEHCEDKVGGILLFGITGIR